MSKKYIEKAAVIALCNERIAIADDRNAKGEATIADAVIAGSAGALKILVTGIPPADVVPVVRGEWIISNGIKGDKEIFVCSACHSVVDIRERGSENEPFNFCPNCGAEMRREDDKQ